MNTFAIVPVKALGTVKSRLKDCLPPEMRSGLLMAMLKDVLRSLSDLPTIVISPEDIRGLLDEKIIFQLQTMGDGLNSAIEQAGRLALELGADSTLFVPADMPLIDKVDVQKILGYGKKYSVVITQAEDGGTGILFRRPPDVMKCRFTNNSFYDHLAEAERSGLKPYLLSSDHLSFDIDTQEDLMKLLEVGRGTEAHRFLINKEFNGFVKNDL